MQLAAAMGLDNLTGWCYNRKRAENPRKTALELQKGDIMLIEFRVANFRSFREEQTLSLVASRDTRLDENLIHAGKLTLVKAVALYGANASGKSNLLEAIRQMKSFVVSSATKMNLGDKIEGIASFRLAPECLSAPSFFEVTLILDGIRFVYGFSATAERVHGEWLMAYPKERRQRWFERQFDEAEGTYTFSFGEELKDTGKLLRERTRENGLVLSLAAELNVKLLGPLFLWFRERLWPVNLSYPPDSLAQQTAKWISNRDDRQEQVARLLRHADLGISALKVARETVVLADLPKEIRDELPGRVMRDLLGGPASVMRVQTEHAVPGASEPALFRLEEESEGTKRLFALAGGILGSLETGATVVVDELDCSMHPLLTRALIELFQSTSANSKGAQLVFATHDTTLMDPELFRRDQLWLVEKDSRGASKLFSLYDFKKKPRTTEALERNYLAGRYGGVPSLGPVFEDSEL